MRLYMERSEHAWTDDSIRMVLTPSTFAKSALFYVQEIGHFHAFGSYFTERERLDSFLIVYTISGRGRLSYGDKTYLLNPNQLFFIDCMEYQYYSSDLDHWELLWVHLNGGSARAYYEQFALKGETVQTALSDSKIPAILRNLIELNHFKSIRNELVTSKLLVELLTELLLSSTEPAFQEAGLPPYIGDILRLIDKRYQEKLTLDILAKTFAMNKYHLAKEFKKHTGFSPGESIINTRISRAKELLQYSDKPVAVIAEQIGIDNVSHFINLFKDRTDKTPLAFRKNWQQMTAAAGGLDQKD